MFSVQCLVFGMHVTRERVSRIVLATPQVTRSGVPPSNIHHLLVHGPHSRGSACGGCCDLTNYKTFGHTNEFQINKLVSCSVAWVSICAGRHFPINVIIAVHGACWRIAGELIFILQVLKIFVEFNQVFYLNFWFLIWQLTFDGNKWMETSW